MTEQFKQTTISILFDSAKLYKNDIVHSVDCHYLGKDMLC